MAYTDVMKHFSPLLFSLLLFSLVTLALAQNDAHQPLLEPTEHPLFSFQVKDSDKVLTLATNAEENYLVYRFGTSDDVELHYPKRRIPRSWQNFSYTFYFRGGGAENEGIDLNNLFFDRGNYRYIIYDHYNASQDSSEVGVIVVTPEGEDIVIEGNPETKIGSLLAFRSHDGVIQSDALPR